MVNSGKYYFLSRSRRLGKSLLLNTFKAYFEGKREVFEGLDITQLEQDWAVRFVLRQRTLFADTPYELVKSLENHYQNLVWMLFKLMGFYTQAEYHTSQGRIDLVVYCYVVELKLNGTAEETMKQISARLRPPLRLGRAADNPHKHQLQQRDPQHRPVPHRLGFRIGGHGSMGEGEKKVAGVRNVGFFA